MICAIAGSGSSRTGKTSCDWTSRKQREGKRRPSHAASWHTRPMVDVGGGWPVSMAVSTSAIKTATACSHVAVVALFS